MIIDSHAHVFWHGRDDKGLIADMDEQNIDAAWLLTWELPPSRNYTPQYDVLNPIHAYGDGSHRGIPLSDSILARDRYPDRFILGYCPDPLSGEAVELFEAAHAMHGVRVCGEWKFRMLFDDPRCLELFRKAGELKCPVVLHLDAPYLFDPESGKSKYYRQWYGGSVDNLERALQACPETVFLGHAPGFWREISGDADQDPEVYPRGPLAPGGKLAALFETYSNLYADLSAGSGLFALQRDPGHAKEFICHYSDRCLFARDYYGGDLYEFLQTLELPKDVQDKLYFQNALRLAGPASAKA